MEKVWGTSMVVIFFGQCPILIYNIQVHLSYKLCLYVRRILQNIFTHMATDIINS